MSSWNFLPAVDPRPRKARSLSAARFAGGGKRSANPTGGNRMTHWTKSLLAGTAALALAASPALAQGAGTAGASGGAAGAASGTTMDSGPSDGGAMRGSADTMDGDMQGDITGS